MRIWPWAAVSSRRVKTCAGSIANQFSKPSMTRRWSISCFYVRRGYRRKGVMASLIREALKTAKRANVPAVEAYPVDTTRPGSTSNVFAGTASTFRCLGFRTIARRQPSRPIMRHDLRGIAL
jgi:GNAT superfamily N-acetyltransferase